MRNWRITWLCIAICGFPWLVFPVKAQQPEWSSATLTGRYAGNGTWGQKVTFDLHRQGNKLFGTYLAQSETGPGKLVGKIGLDGSIELHEVDNGNVYGTFTLRKSSTGSYGGEWLAVGKDEAYNLQLAPLAVAALPSSNSGNPQSKLEGPVKQKALRIPKEVTGPDNIEPQKSDKSASLLSSSPVSSTPGNLGRAAPRNTSGSPIGRRYSAEGYASSSDKATLSASLEAGPSLPVAKNDAKTVNRFPRVFEEASAGYVATASLIIIVLGVILGISKKLVVLRGLKDLFAAISVRLRSVLPSSRSTLFSKSAPWTHFESLFARFLEECDDIISFTKNCQAVHFRLNYVNADGEISNYYPDFIVKMSAKEIYVVDTKGLEDLDVPVKMQRLRLWCEDINRMQSEVKLDFVYVDMETFEKYQPKSFRQLVDTFVAYKARQFPAASQSSPTPATTPLPQQS